tara:strand:- start:2323 stop:3420 length:1098 start_codon:yes stop_codon:yes gene_type:complete
LKVGSTRAKIFKEDSELILSEMEKVFESKILTQGPFVERFEKEFSKKFSVTAKAVNSGSSALEIIMNLLPSNKEEVLLPANTIYLDAAAILKNSLRPVFYDVGENDFFPSLEQIKSKVTDNTAAIMVVHLGGFIPENIFEIKEFCESKGIALIEDAAHAAGSKIKDIFAGSIGDFSAFSFFPTKIITSCEGGIVCCKDESLSEKVDSLRNQGLVGEKNENFGYNYRMSELHGIVGYHQIKRLDEFIAHRQSIAKIYDAEIKSSTLTKMEFSSDCFPNFYKYPCTLNGANRMQVKEKMKELDIVLTGEVYSVPCYKQPVFKDQEFYNETHGNADWICANHICLPMDNNIEVEQAKYVAEKINEVFP